MSFHHSSLSMMNTIRYEYAEDSSSSSGGCTDPAFASFKQEPTASFFNESEFNSIYDTIGQLEPYGNSTQQSNEGQDLYGWNPENSISDVKLGLPNTEEDDFLSVYNNFGDNCAEPVLSSIHNIPHDQPQSHHQAKHTKSEPLFDSNNIFDENTAGEDYSLADFPADFDLAQIAVDQFSAACAEAAATEVVHDHPEPRRVIVGGQPSDYYTEERPVETYKDEDFGEFWTYGDENSSNAVCGEDQDKNSCDVSRRRRSSSTSGHRRCSGDKSTEPQEQQMAGGFYKPMYSFSCLIGLALKNSSNGELTVSEIYAFLCEHFPYFRVAPSGWKNSVRHNLSLNKCFQKIEVETPGCHGRKSCLWRLNPHRESKMDQELRKARERNEPSILRAMTKPDDLDSIQNGTKGMPSTVRRRVIVPVDEENNTTYVMKSTQPKIIRRMPYSNSSSNRSSDSSNSFSVAQHQPLKLAAAASGESMREAAARKLDYLLQQKSAIAYNPEEMEGGSISVHQTPAPRKRSSGGSSTHGYLKNEEVDFDFENIPPPGHRRSSGASNSHRSHNVLQSSLKHSPPTQQSHQYQSYQHSGSQYGNENRPEPQPHPSRKPTTSKHYEAYSGPVHYQSSHNQYPPRSIESSSHSRPLMPKIYNSTPKHQNSQLFVDIKSSTHALSAGHTRVPMQSSHNTMNNRPLRPVPAIDNEMPERSLSPLHYNSSCYDIVTSAVSLSNNSLLLESPFFITQLEHLSAIDLVLKGSPGTAKGANVQRKQAENEAHGFLLDTSFILLAFDDKRITIGTAAVAMSFRNLTSSLPVAKISHFLSRFFIYAV
ncbi:forkhead domain-containing protein [Ditylenchus destructor]|nr:forkhead domain-containing protein [Ditylenchus destructor]